MYTQYDKELRLSMDKMLQKRAAIGATMYQVPVLASMWGHRGFHAALAVCAGHAILSTIMGKHTVGRMDRRFANRGFFIANAVYSIALPWACDFAAPSLFVLPLCTLFYEGFGEGELRPYLVATISVVGTALLLLGAPLAPVVVMLVLSALIHWFSEGRAETLRVAHAELRSKHGDLGEANQQLSAARAELEVKNRDLQSSFDELQAAHERMIQVDKMVAIGQLAAGVAHEINNPLAVILGFAQGLQRRADPSWGLTVPIESIVRESIRCKDLVQELLVFSRTGSRPKEPVELEPLIRSTAHLLDARARAQNTVLELDLHAPHATIDGNRTQLQQIIVNLANNSFDAVGDGGRVVLRTLEDDGGISIEVVDDGPGIPDAIKPRIFDPFFTTKEVGAGTGLGLSLAYEMVQKHGGTIAVETGPGSGTTMRIHFPVQDHVALVAAGGQR
jgi:signal transduction histidine kinase